MSIVTSKTAKIIAGVAVLSFAFALVASAATVSFDRSLTVGSTGADVMNLQKLLNSDPATQIATSGAGSPGSETTYFGSRTRAAVAKFQAKYGISPAVGYFGPITRAKASTINFGGGVVVAPVGTGLSVSAPMQPGNSLAPKSAARVPFTKVTLTAGTDGDVTVNSITVERTGLAQDAAFSGIVLLDENGLQIGNAKTLNSNHQALIGEPFTVRAGTSKTVTVAGNMNSNLDSYANQVASLTVVAVNTSASVSGVLPVTGASHTLNNTLSMGSASMVISSFDPGTPANKEVGTTGYKFSGVRLTAGSAEKVRLYSVRWNQTGSASASDLANLVTVVDGVSYPTTVSADGKYLTTIFPGGLLIDKGFSKDVYVQGDIVGTGAANRTVDFDIYKTTDIYIVGETYGYGITPSGSGSRFSNSSNPYFNGYAVTVTAGSATTIAKSNSVAAQNVAVNVPDQILGGFETNFKGEPVSVQQTTFTVSTSTAHIGGLLTNVSIFDQNGAIVAGPVDAVASTTGNQQTLTFTDTITFPVGKAVYTVKGKINSSAVNGAVITLNTNPAAWSNVTGQITGNTITLSQTGFNMNPVTVKAAALAVAVSASPAAQSIVAGSREFTFANYQFDATQSGENLRFASLGLTLTAAGGGAVTDLTNCQLFDGSTSLNTSNVVNPSAAASTFTLDSALVVPKGTIKTLALKCDVSSAVVAGTYKWGITDTQIGAISVTGVTSSNSVTASGATNLGQLITVGSGSLAVSTDASSPSYALAADNTSGNILGVYKFRASNEAVNLERVGLKLTNTASSSASDLVQVSLYSGNTLLGNATFVGSNAYATSTFASPFLLPKDTDVAITVKGEFAGIGSSQSGTSGHLIAVDVDTNGTNTQGKGVGSGSAINATGSTAVSGVRVFPAYPTFTKLSVPTNTLNNGSQSLLRFKVTANGGDVGIAKFTVRVATTTATISGLNILAYTDSGFSTPVSGIGSSGEMLATALTMATWASSATDLEISAQTSAGASTTIQVPSGASRYFDVTATVAGATTGASVQTQIQGDAAYPSLSGFMSNYVTINADSNNDFIWSPNSTTTTTTDGEDWTNGYGVVGLPGANMTAEVLSK